MNQLSTFERKTIIEFFFKRSTFYAKVGHLFAFALLTELAALTLPKELTPDYTQWIVDYGRIITYTAAFFIGKYFGGQLFISLFIKVFILWLCMHYDNKLKAVGKNYLFIKNWNIGIGNSIKNKITK
jgi:hypothetical protein